LSLDFAHRGLNLSSLMAVPYIRGWYEKAGTQLYMNRGIGITGFPIQLGARPEITVGVGQNLTSSVSVRMTGYSDDPHDV